MIDQTILATLLGTVTGGILGFVSAYLLQRQRFKRENIIEMKDKIYGPMFVEINNLKEDLKKPRFRFDFGNLEKVMDDYRFPAVKQDLKDKLFSIQKRTKVYEKILWATEEIFNQKLTNLINRKYEIPDPGNPPNPHLTLYLEKAYIDTLKLKEAVFQQISPADFINNAKDRYGNNLSTEVFIKTSDYSLSDFEYLYNNIMKKMKKENLFIEEKDQRSRLNKDTNVLIEEIKDRLDLP